MIWYLLVLLSEVFSLYMIITSEILHVRLKGIFGTFVVFTIVITAVLTGINWRKR